MPLKDPVLRREYQREYNRKLYLKNREAILLTRKARREVGKKFLRRYKCLLSCTNCGISFKEHPYVCDFHHTDPSTKEHRLTYIMDCGIQRIKDEIRKCIPLCANCHRIHHAEEG
jgi:hypothetical protein